MRTHREFALVPELLKIGFQPSQLTELVDVEGTKRLPIRRVYGQLGDSGFALRERQTVRGACSTVTLVEAAKGIRIIPEARDDDPCCQEVREWFDWLTERSCSGLGLIP